jgi:hypothetical protein
MKTIVTDREMLTSISSLDLKAYLMAQGWTAFDKIKDKAIVLKKDGTNEELILPLRKELGDFALAVINPLILSLRIAQMIKKKFKFSLACIRNVTPWCGYKPQTVEPCAPSFV